MLDELDYRILRHLQSDPIMTHSELAERLHLSVSRLTRRVEQLRARHVLRAARAVINWPALGFMVEVSLRVSVDKAQPRAFEDLSDAARKIPEIIEIQTFLGRVDMRLSVIARDMAHYQKLYREKILTLPHVADIEALMHVARIKSDEKLPL